MDDSSSRKSKIEDLSYGDAPYWNQRYSNEASGTTFDWYQPYSELKGLFNKFLTKDSKILMVGCGNAVMSEKMVEDGYKDIVNIDISDVAINNMSKRNEHIPRLKYATMDARKLTYDANSFDGVIDKGTLDALMCGGNSTENARDMLKEALRVLRPGASFIMITYGDPRTRMSHLQHTSLQWTVRLYIMPRPGAEPFENPAWLLTPAELDATTNKLMPMNIHVDSSNLHFIYVCTKPM